MIQRALLILMGIMLAVICSLGMDRVAGVLFIRAGFFQVMIPNETIVMDTSEFRVNYTISSQGLRNPEVAKTKPDNVYRILALGDSHTYGWGVEEPDTWVRRLEHTLSVPGKKVEIINAGVPSFDLEQQQNVCKIYADRFSVDAIFVEHFGTVDYYRTMSRSERKGELPTLIASIWPNFVGFGEQIFGETSGGSGANEPIYVTDVWQWQVRKLLSENPHMQDRIDPEILRLFLDGKLIPSHLWALTDPDYYVRLLSVGDYHTALALTQKSLAALIKNCAKGRPVTVVMLPSPDLVSTAYHGTIAKMGFHTDPRLTTFDWDTELRDIVHGLGAQYVSVLPAMRADGCPGCYYPYDTHMNALGNLRVAEVLSASLSGTIKP